MLKKRDTPLKTWDEIFKQNGVTWEKSIDGESHISIEIGDHLVPFDKNLNPFSSDYKPQHNTVVLSTEYVASDYKVDEQVNNESLSSKISTIGYHAYYEWSKSHYSTNKSQCYLKAS